MKNTTCLLLLLTMPVMVKAQLQNSGFETWAIPVAQDQMAHNRPAGWTIDNGRGLGPVNAYFDAATDAHDGNYALMLGIWYNYIKDFATQTAPIASRPAAVTGYYKYSENLVLNDSGQMYDEASVRVYLTKWNEASARHDTIGKGEIYLSGAVDYTVFNCPVTYTSNDMPDAVTVVLDCSLMDHEGYSIQAPNGFGSLFTVDDIVFTDEVLGIKQVQQKSAVYPNPVSDVLNFSQLATGVQVYDITGKLVLSQEQLHKSISIINLQAGVYHIKFNDGTAIRYSKFIKQ